MSVRPVSHAVAVAAKSVIVADDTAFVRDRFSVALQTSGHTVSAVSTGSELLSRVRRGDRVDLVVLDLRLPQARGVAIVRTLRGIDGFRAPIVVFSGTIADADEVRELGRLGVSGYVNEYTAMQHIVPALASHLFPDEDNRREGPRVSLGVSVSYRVGNLIAAAVTLNVGAGGLAIRTTSAIEPETVIKARFRLPGTGSDLDVEARVVWADRRSGLGLRFTKIDPGDQKMLDDFVRGHFFSNRKA